MLFPSKKTTVINDPVHGFITVPSPFIFAIIEHPYFQRLRRIRQMGFSEYVYPGAVHTRFQHALGAMHLMGQALDILKSKGVDISPEESEAAQIAVLLHDIGHGPFSHALEQTLMNVHHEELGKILFQELNQELEGQLDRAYQMFTGQYERSFFHYLVSSQLDVDRLDYLRRDSFFSGVVEGSVGSSRILHMLDVHEDQLVLSEKGLNSVEHFLNVRRLMYWQVYLHKTNVSAEQMLIKCLERARFLLGKGEMVDASPNLLLLLQQNLDKQRLLAEKQKYLKAFTRLDDTDIWSALKRWARSEDVILRYLSQSMLQRRIFKIKMQNQPFEAHLKHEYAQRIHRKFEISEADLKFLLVDGQVGNLAYMGDDQPIRVRTKKGKLLDLAEAADLPQIKAISNRVIKHFLCRPRDS